jgi:hypothetical protein
MQELSECVNTNQPEMNLPMMKIMSLGIGVPNPLISSDSALSSIGITSISPLYKSNPKSALPLANSKTTKKLAIFLY